MANRDVRVKICGLRDAGSAAMAVEAGADALGFILAPSRRQIAPEEIRAIRVELRARFGTLPPMVAVVVNAPATQIARDVAVSGVDMIQLSGDECPELLEDIDVPVIKALRFGEGTTSDAAKREISRWLDRPRPPRWLLIEGHAAGSYGGTGTRADWELAAAIAPGFPIWLAGGLHPDNVGDAIATVAPSGVDVSSGIETDGVKEHAKIEAFISNAWLARSQSR